jgi:hypothetical protein
MNREIETMRKELHVGKFNNGKPYHGSEAVAHGRLQGATGSTDYFFFFCPKCPDRYIMRILDCGVRHELADNPANKRLQKKAAKGFVLAFKLYCENCKHEDFVKIDNIGLQGGLHKDTLLEPGVVAALKTASAEKPSPIKLIVNSIVKYKALLGAGAEIVAKAIKGAIGHSPTH